MQTSLIVHTHTLLISGVRTAQVKRNLIAHQINATLWICKSASYMIRYFILSEIDTERITHVVLCLLPSNNTCPRVSYSGYERHVCCTDIVCVLILSGESLIRRASCERLVPRAPITQIRSATSSDQSNTLSGWRMDHALLKVMNAKIFIYMKQKQFAFN